MTMAAVVTLSSVTVGALLVAESAAAAVPAFPDNIVVFPDRDFISIDGFDGHAGETATVTVRRDGEVIGQAQGDLAGGSPSLEVNHPGGVCWGTGPGAPNVTPDIRPGDVVSVSVGGTELADTRTSSGTVAPVGSEPAVTRTGATLEVRGHVGADVTLAQVEQRIIAPALVDTVVAKRDVRAVPGDLVPAPRGGYSSSLVFDTGLATGPASFLATYVFDNESEAVLAEAGGARFMTWEVEDLDANRQGLTIAEFGELGGPGFGGCPNGPLQSGPPAPNGISVIDTAAGPGPRNLVFTWTPAVAVPGTPAVTGYRVVAVDTTVNAAGEQAETGVRINNPGATGTTLAVEPGKTYTLEVRSVNAVGNETIPPATVGITAPDTTPPTVAFSPVATSFVTPTSITLSSEPGAQIFFALSDPLLAAPALVSGDELSGAPVTLYTTPIALTTSTRVSVVAFDAAGNLSAQVDRVISITTADTPGTTTSVTATGGEGQVSLSWPAVTDPAGAPVTDYVVDWTGPQAGTRTLPRGDSDPVTTVVTGLDAGDYSFTVTARNEAGAGAASSAATATVTEQLTVTAGADRSVTRGGAGVGLAGSTPNSGVTYLWERVASESVDATTVGGTSFLSATNVPNPTVTLPTVPLPTGPIADAAGFDARNAPLFYRLTVSKAGATSVRDVVKVTVGTDAVTIATGRWRAGNELRLSGSVTNAGATVRVYGRTAGSTQYVYIGTATLTPAPGGATWDLRIRTAVPPNQPWYAFSTFGGGAGPFTT
jgi:hypothetical protein